MHKKHPPPAPSRGFVLVVVLIMLIVVSLMVVSMARSYNMGERLAGNVKEKARAFQMAQSTLAYAEYLLVTQSKSLATSSNCLIAQSAPTICNNGVVIQNPTTGNALLTLANGTVYSTMQPPITISTSGGSGTYYAYPQYYLQFLGTLSGGNGTVYQVTALAYGGNPNAVAVVQSTYKVVPNISNLGDQ